MLPGPVLLPKRRHFRRNSNTVLPRQKIIDFLISRARITNFAFFLLAFLFFISILFNLKYLVTTTPATTPQSISSTIGRTKIISSFDHLILVPCHAIWTGPSADLRGDENYWILEPYQRRSGRVEAFFQHILKAAELSLQDEHSLVIFSGGQTRNTATMTEGESYLQLALQADVFRTSFSFATPRATSENYALDSYQNLLFGVARFKEYTGRYPAKITVVGYAMKQRRFEHLHRQAIRWPINKFSYIGIDPVDGPEERASAREGELQNGYLPYTDDLYGCHSQLLSKRLSRNPHMRFHSYFTSSPELSELLDFCPDNADTSFDKKLPWS